MAPKHRHAQHTLHTDHTGPHWSAQVRTGWHRVGGTDQSTGLLTKMEMAQGKIRPAHMAVAMGPSRTRRALRSTVPRSGFHGTSFLASN